MSAKIFNPTMEEFLHRFIGVEAPDADDWFGLQQAYEAAILSDDPSTQVGAYINGVLGWNRQVDECPPTLEKNWCRVHAETDALLNSEWTEGGTLYAPWACCLDCATSILAAGVGRVVIHEERMKLTPKKWEGEVISGLRTLIRNDVKVDCYSTYFGYDIRVNGGEAEL